MSFWNGPAFLAGRNIPARSIWPMPSLGQSSSDDFLAEFESYRAAIAQLPASAQASIASTVSSCEILLQSQNFTPIRARGCLNSLLAQIRAAGGNV